MQTTQTKSTIQLLNLLTLLQAKQTLEALENYKEFCYQLYLYSSALSDTNDKRYKKEALGVVNVTAKVFNVAKTAVHSANFISSGINKVTAFKAAAHGIARGIIQTAQGGSFKAGFMSGVSSGFDVGTSAMGGNTVGGFVARTVTMGVVGGTASALGGGKFSNGAMSGAFTHMFNAEARVSISASAGAGAGGTIERGLTVAHDSKQPWYKGWTIGTFKNYAVGGYHGVDATTEVNIGWSKNNSIYALENGTVTVGGGVGKFGYEVTTGSGISPLHNISYELPFSAQSPVPYEVHVYNTQTTVNQF